MVIINYYSYKINEHRDTLKLLYWLISLSEFTCYVDAILTIFRSIAYSFFNFKMKKTTRF